VASHRYRPYSIRVQMCMPNRTPTWPIGLPAVLVYMLLAGWIFHVWRLINSDCVANKFILAMQNTEIRAQASTSVVQTLHRWISASKINYLCKYSAYSRYKHRSAPCSIFVFLNISQNIYRPNGRKITPLFEQIVNCELSALRKYIRIRSEVSHFAQTC